MIDMPMEGWPGWVQTGVAVVTAMIDTAASWAEAGTEGISGGMEKVFGITGSVAGRERIPP